MEKVTALDGAKIADAVYRFDLQVAGYEIAIDKDTKQPITYENPTTNLQIALYQNTTTKNYVIAFRGTEPLTYGDWDTNVRMFVSTLVDTLPVAFVEALQVIDPIIEAYGLNSGNTSIVGHSMGGSIAQYIGSAKGFETLTYNAYGIGNMDVASGGSNITNYVTLSDFVSKLPMSSMIGTTYMLQDGDLLDILGHGITNFTSEENWVRGYTPIDDIHSIYAIDGLALSAIDIAAELIDIAIEGRRYATINGSMDDVIIGGEKYNLLIGGSGKDTLYGMGGSDNLQGGKDDDTLYGGNEDEDYNPDVFYGGEGFDTYIAGGEDEIFDEDGEGEVYFDETLLTGGKKEAGSGCEPTEDDGSSVYKGNGGTYTLSGDTLTFEKGGETLTILNFSSGKLGITLEDSSGGGNDCPPPGGQCPSPVSPSFGPHFPVPYTNPGGSGGGSVHYYGGGSGSGSVYYPSTPHYTPTPPTPVVKCVNHPDYSSAGAGGGGGSTGPIVLDLNHDGITSISIAASIALFDYDGDGIKENTAWIQSTDALLVNDVNNDGLINDASELFGNYTRNSDGSIAKGGYQALSYYDSNKDNIIDANDERFGELKVWVDSDGDGVTDDGELKTLSELGITSLSINTSTPYMATTEETNTIIQETTFTDAQGEGIMRDVLFRYENNSEPEDGVYFDMDGNGIKEKMTTWTDPNQWMVVRDLNGDGKITRGREVVGNHMILNDGTTAPDTIQALKTFDINHDGVIDASDNSGLAFWTDRNHNGLTDVGELEALGA